MGVSLSASMPSLGSQHLKLVLELLKKGHQQGRALLYLSLGCFESILELFIGPLESCRLAHQETSVLRFKVRYIMDTNAPMELIVARHIMMLYGDRASIMR